MSLSFRASSLRGMLVLLVPALLVSLPGLAQRGAADSPTALELIQQLQPSANSGTRGIRIPAEPSASGAPGTAAAPAKPMPPPRLATTAPAGVGAASISVRFGTGSAELAPEALRSLDALGQALTSAELAQFRFRIEGHTDTVGTAEANQILSERRAATVRDYLASRHRISPDRLEILGLGESQLLVTTPDETANARNRRVQVVNLGG